MVQDLSAGPIRRLQSFPLTAKSFFRDGLSAEIAPDELKIEHWGQLGRKLNRDD
jgi:hypothetical protein